jgi:glycosyltransferase involved in cell wall biosynthesis
MVGRGPLESDIDAQIAGAGLHKYITRIDRIDDSAHLWALMKGAGVVLAPSDREGFGLVAAESLALGTPVVTSTHRDNAAALLVTPSVTGSIVAVDDIEGFATEVARWLDAPGDAAAISEYFWAQHPECDWAVSARRWLEVLRATAERRTV